MKAECLPPSHRIRVGFERGPCLALILSDPMCPRRTNTYRDLVAEWMWYDLERLAFLDIHYLLPVLAGIGGSVNDARQYILNNDDIAVFEVEEVGRDRFKGRFADSWLILFGQGDC